jgi:hypothetical protein
VSDILRNGPLPIDLTVSMVFIDVCEQEAKARHETAKTLYEV